MVRKRIIVGASGTAESAQRAAKRLLDEGHEVVFVGGDQTPEHLLGTAIAEDSGHIVFDASPVDLDRLRAACAELGEEAPDVCGL